MDSMFLFVTEFVGTILLVFLGDSVNANLSLKGTFAKGAGWAVTTLGWAAAVAIPASIMGGAGGPASFNPALTLGHAIAGLFDWALVPIAIGAQMLGGFVGAWLVFIFFKPHFDAEEDGGTKLGVFSTGPAIPNVAFNFISEMIATFMLVFLLTLSSGLPSFLNVWLVIMVLGMALGGTTGYALNPARDTAPRIAYMTMPMKNKVDANWGYGWIPTIAPIVGATLGALAAVALNGIIA